MGWAVEPLSRVLLDENPAVDEVEGLPAARHFQLGDARSAVVALRHARYDLALDFQGLWKSAAWARLSGARRVLGYARPWRREPASALLVSEQVPLPPDAVHVIDKNLALLRGIGIDAVGTRQFPLPDTAAEASRVDHELRASGLRDFVVLNPGGGWTSKLWPAERFGALAVKLRDRGLPAVVTWGPGEEALADRVVAASGGIATRSFPHDLAGVRRDRAPGPARRRRRHRHASPRLRDRDARGRALRTHRPGAERALRARGQNGAACSSLRAVPSASLPDAPRHHGNDHGRRGVGGDRRAPRAACRERRARAV